MTTVTGRCDRCGKEGLLHPLIGATLLLSDAPWVCLDCLWLFYVTPPYTYAAKEPPCKSE